MKKENISFTDDGLKYLISHYTREAGLRNLEREVGSVCRKIAKQVVLGETQHVEITSTLVPELLGPPRYLRDEKLNDSEKYEIVTEFDKVFGLKPEEEEIEVPEEVGKLAKKREEARKKKNWKESDEIRNRIRKLGYWVNDTDEGAKITKL